MVVITGVAVDMTGGRGAGSGLMRLAIWSLSSTVRKPLAQSTRGREEGLPPLHPHFLELLNELFVVQSTSGPGWGGRFAQMECSQVLDEVGKQVTTKHTMDLT